MDSRPTNETPPSIKTIPNKTLVQRGNAIQALGVFVLFPGIFLALSLGRALASLLLTASISLVLIPLPFALAAGAQEDTKTRITFAGLQLQIPKDWSQKESPELPSGSLLFSKHPFHTDPFEDGNPNMVFVLTTSQEIPELDTLSEQRKQKFLLQSVEPTPLQNSEGVTVVQPPTLIKNQLAAQSRLEYEKDGTRFEEVLYSFLQNNHHINFLFQFPHSEANHYKPEISEVLKSLKRAQPNPSDIPSQPQKNKS
jgi:hypothetical protein